MPQPDPRTPYFAYGANMASHHMRSLCTAPTVLGVAAVPGYEFRIARRGYGTIVENPGAVTYGVLWSLTDEDFRALDEFERVADGHYVRDTIRLGFGGDSIDAQIYLASDPGPGRPRAGYLEAVIRAAREIGLPAEYVARLERLSATGTVPDQSAP